MITGSVGPRLAVADRESLRALSARIDPGDAGGYNNLGVLYFNKGMIVEAVDAFHRALEIDPAVEVAARNLEIAYLSTGHYDRLIEELNARLRQNPEDRDARLRLARAHRHTDRPTEAATELRRLLAAMPSDPRLLLELGLAEKAADRFDEAHAAYTRALKVEPESAVLHFFLGQLYYHQGNSEGARRSLSRAVELEPGLGEAWHLLAFVLGDLGDDHAARDALERGQALRPSLNVAELSIDRRSEARYQELLGDRASVPTALPSAPLAHYHLGIAFRRKGLYREALGEFARGRQAGEDPLLLTQAEAEVLLVGNRLEAACTLYRKLLKEGPESPKLHNELGVCLHRMGEVEAAESSYRAALAADPEYGVAENNLGVVWMDRGDPEAACSAFERAARAGLIEPLYNLGLHASNSDRPAEALKYYRRAIEVDPHSAPAWTGVGAVLSDLGRLAEARNALARAIENGPKLAEPRYRLGFVLNRLGELDASMRETRRALTLDPYFTTPRYRLAIDLHYEYAEVLAPELSTDTRLSTGETVVDFDPEPEELAAIFARLGGGPDGRTGKERQGYSLALDYLGKGLTARAIAEVRRVALAGGDPVEAALLTGQIYRSQHLEGEALERFDAALTRLEGVRWGVQHERAWLGRGWSLLALGRATAAREAAATVQARNPTLVEPRRLVAEALLLEGRAGEALERFGRLASQRSEDVELLMRLAAAARAAGHAGEAMNALARVLDLDPDLVAARIDLGTILLEECRFQEAAAEARVALEILPGYSEAALLLAEAEYARGAVQTAVSTIVELLEEDVYHLPALQRLGEMLASADRISDAIVAFSRVLRFDPDAIDAQAALNDALARAAGSEQAAPPGTVRNPGGVKDAN